MNSNKSWYSQLQFYVLDVLLTALYGDLSADLSNVNINNYLIVFILLVCVDIGSNIVVMMK